MNWKTEQLQLWQTNLKLQIKTILIIIEDTSKVRASSLLYQEEKQEEQNNPQDGRQSAVGAEERQKCW